MKQNCRVAATCVALAFLLCACRHYDAKLEGALWLAGDNRAELERVLAHYEGDSLKLEAAKFLIRNMPGHYSYADTSACIYYNAVDSALDAMKGKSVWEIKDSLEVITDKLSLSVSKASVQDVEVVTADYLIRNIDEAFDQWKNGPWATHLDFEQFCEYLLPYKTDELQQLDNWRSYLAEQFGKDIEGLGYCDAYRNSAIQATVHVNRNLRNNLHPVISINRIMPVRRFSTRVKLPFGTCADYMAIATAAFRSCGIPVAYDFTPQWPFRSMGHTWNVLLANSGKTMPFAGTESNPGEPHKLDEKMAKVFRWTYVANPELLRLEEVEGYIPPTFRTPFLRDVTAEYMDCTDVEVEIENGTDGRYAYLAVFDNDSWVPVDFARINDGRACFKNVGRNIAYLPLRYDADDEDIPAGAPFILTYEGKAEKIVADTIHRQAVNLLRKYPATPHACTWSWRALNGVFQAADNPEFERAETIYEIKGWAVSGTEVVVPDSCGAYRYWRYWQPHEFCNMAEICFISKQTGQFVEGRIIGTEGSWGNNGNDRSKAFDHNPLTFFDAPCHGAWVGVDFGEPIALDKILYVWRGDGNAVEIGDEYELLYWNNGDWHSLGKQKANRMNLVYEHVPRDALFWLRDLTKGKEERIFTYEGDRQIWW